ncbi:hypothetical protein KSP39_PZI014333 [Platanthera zijinensis]|uniref:Uncharacterized protein n=1 Tax=Platanthera zijinensis TaxID=2320716 RepID=A0AAP0BAL9_9ASPA
MHLPSQGWRKLNHKSEDPSRVLAGGAGCQTASKRSPWRASGTAELSLRWPLSPFLRQASSSSSVKNLEKSFNGRRIAGG